MCIRDRDQTGSRVDFTGESIATYDFSDNLRKFQWGLQLGGESVSYTHLDVYKRQVPRSPDTSVPVEAYAL